MRVKASHLRSSGGALRAAITEPCYATFCPARVTNKKVQKLLVAAHHIAFLSPPLRDSNARTQESRCVEGSFVAFFYDPAVFPCETHAYNICFSLLYPADCFAVVKG